jgi:sortase A
VAELTDAPAPEDAPAPWGPPDAGRRRFLHRSRDHRSTTQAATTQGTTTQGTATQGTTTPGTETKATKATKVTKWDRPPHPRDWRFWVGGLGRVLLAAGILMFGFVAYQLWGTGIETARAQRSLENEFEDLLAERSTTTVPEPTVEATTPVDGTTAPPSTAAVTPGTTPTSAPPAPVSQDIPPIAEGDAIAQIEIPSIGVKDIVVAGVSVADLRRGPGHFPETPLPGQLGNAAIAGHRTTYGQPFRNVDDLEPGDEIVITTVAGRFVYDVTGTQIVKPNEYGVVLTSNPDVASVTLVSCDPVWSATRRIVITGELDVAASDPAGVPTPYAVIGPDGELSAPAEPTTVPSTAATTPAAATATAPATTTGGSTPTATTLDTAADTSASVPPSTAPGATSGGAAVSERSQDAFSGGWFSDEGAFAQVALWGLALTAISIGAWLLSRRTRHDLIGLAVGIVPFTLALFFFFQNVNRLLPPSL